MLVNCYLTTFVTITHTPPDHVTPPHHGNSTSTSNFLDTDELAEDVKEKHEFGDN